MVSGLQESALHSRVATNYLSAIDVEVPSRFSTLTVSVRESSISISVEDSIVILLSSTVIHKGVTSGRI